MNKMARFRIDEMAYSYDYFYSIFCLVVPETMLVIP